jgi:hypothetical protein
LPIKLALFIASICEPISKNACTGGNHVKKIKKVGSVSEFLNREEKSVMIQIGEHFSQNKTVYYVAGSTGILLLSGFDSAAEASTVSAIDKVGGSLYYKLCNVGKWIIVFKGGIETIRRVSEGDMQATQRTFLSHLLIYLVLLGLPWGMDQVDHIFDEMSEIQ